MDAAISSALEEICAAGPTGLTPPSLFSRLSSSITSLSLTPSVQQPLWTNLLAVPTLRFLDKSGQPISSTTPSIQSVEDAVKLNLVIVADDSLRDCFVGVYDLKAREGFKGFSSDMLKSLQHLAAARANGITQSQLAKELGKGGNEVFYILRNLECQGLIERQSAVVRTMGVCEEGDLDTKTAVTTNMVYLSRYAKHLGSQQRLEINKENRAGCDGTEDGISEYVHVNDFLPAMKAICDELDAADNKVLLVKDIKQTLGYRLSSGHKAWTGVCQRLKDAGLVEELISRIDNKDFQCLRLLKEFSQKSFKAKNSECGTDATDAEQANPKHVQLSEQLVELPLENQIYDMVDAAGEKGLTLVELCKRLGISNKRYYSTFVNMFSRYGMPLREEGHKKGMVYRVWTSRNFFPDSANEFSRKMDSTSTKYAASTLHADDPMPQDITAITVLDFWKPASDNQLSNTVQDGSLLASPVVGDFSLIQTQDPEGCTILRSDACTDQQLAAVTMMAESDIVPSEISPLPTSSSSKSQSYHKDPTLTAKREQRILERLQEEKFIIRSELQRWLESLENEKRSAMDSKTLNRLLRKLQDQGLCKCYKVGVPFSSNCRRQRTKEVVLHPSIQSMTPEIANQIQERLRYHELECRTRGQNKLKDDSSVPILDGVHKIPKKIVSSEQIRKSEIMQANGFVLSKIIRAKLLHIFLWDNLSRASDWGDALSSGKPGYDSKNPYSTCKLFVLNDAIKAMPLELFSQVVGSTCKLDESNSKFRTCSLKDLPAKEYKSVMDSLASIRLSGVIDILRRMELIRLVTEDDSQGEGQPLLDANYKYAMELKPYIEEPQSTYSMSSNHHFSNLRPLVRHDFVLSSREAVDDYWRTLEFCYSAADRNSAVHAFPGSSVQELFRFRSWTSPELMTADKRDELQKRIVMDDPRKKLSFKECEKIAKDLDLTVQQVLAYKNKQMYRNRNRSERDLEDTMEEFQHPKCLRSSTSRKRKRYPESKKQVGRTRNTGVRARHGALTDMGSTPQVHLEHGRSDVMEEQIFSGEEDHHSLVAQCFHSNRRPRFSWTVEADRQLVIQYARCRAFLGPKINRAEWNSIEDLPAGPDVCRRRMAVLKDNPKFSSALTKLLNTLSSRYMKHLREIKSLPLEDGSCKKMTRDHTGQDVLEHAGDHKEKWDDFDIDIVKTALDEVLQHTRISKMKHVPEEPQDSRKRRRKSLNAKSSRPRIPKNLVRVLSKGGGVGKEAYESLAVSNAVELFKLVFLSTSCATEVPNVLAETLRRYSERDLFAAYNFLREKKILIGGSGGNSYELSQVFLQRFSASPFPVDTGEVAQKFMNWVSENEKDLAGEGTDLTPDLECGDIFQLFSLVSSGELSMAPCLPDDGVGEPEDTRVSKRQTDNSELCNDGNTKRQKRSSVIDSDITSRREKGFPGIKVSLNRTALSWVNAVELFKEADISSKNDKFLQDAEKAECHSLCSENLKTDFSCGPDTPILMDSNTSTWEDMVKYAACLTSTSSDQEVDGSFFPEIFKEVYQAVETAGDQGVTLEKILEVADTQGSPCNKTMTKIVVEVLEVFGLAMQVNAYDSVHIVDSRYLSKYFLTRAAGSSLTVQLPSNCQDMKVGSESVESKGQRTASDDTMLPTTKTGVENINAHGVTILDYSDEVPPSSSNKPSSRQDGKLINLCPTSSHSYVPILPWMNGDGAINKTIYKGLIRRVIGAVMQNPGMLEEDIIRRMDVLNPQSCKTLLGLLKLEKHLIVRKMRQTIPGKPPSMLTSLLRRDVQSLTNDVIWREHFFANPSSCHLL